MARSKNIGDIRIAVSEVLKHRRLTAGLSQKALGDEVGLTQAAVSQLEAGAVNSLNTLALVATALGTSLSTVIKDAEDKYLRDTQAESAAFLRQYGRMVD